MIKLVPGLPSELLQSELVAVLGDEAWIFLGLVLCGDFSTFTGDTSNFFLGNFKVHTDLYCFHFAFTSGVVLKWLGYDQGFTLDYFLNSKVIISAQLNTIHHL